MRSAPHSRTIRGARFPRRHGRTPDDQTRRVAHLSCGLCAGVLILVVAAPPLVGLGLRVPGRRVLPLLLTPERRQVEEGPHTAERLHATGRREVGTKDAVAAAQEDAEPERLAVLVDV